MLGTTDIVAFVAITDGGKARAFYEGILGLRFVKDDGFALVFEANGIMVRAAKMKELKPAQYTVLGWQVTKIEDTVRSLSKSGVKFEIFGFFKQDELGIWTAPTGDKVAWFKDPDTRLSILNYQITRFTKSLDVPPANFHGRRSRSHLASSISRAHIALFAR